MQRMLCVLDLPTVNHTSAAPGLRCVLQSIPLVAKYRMLQPRGAVLIATIGCFVYLHTSSLHKGCVLTTDGFDHATDEHRKPLGSPLGGGRRPDAWPLVHLQRHMGNSNMHVWRANARAIVNLPIFAVVGRCIGRCSLTHRASLPALTNQVHACWVCLRNGQLRSYVDLRSAASV